MQFEQLEIEIMNRLTTSLGANVEVELEPETESANKIPFAKPRISVMFDQSEYDTQNSTSSVVQDETCRLAVIIRSRLLRGPSGIYTVVENVRRSLVGYQPCNWSKIWLVKFTFLKRDTNLWEYVLLLSSKTMIVEEAPDETAPALTGATATYTDNQFN